jgi:hypothetical protein
MQPEVLVLDESTAMLDPLGRTEVLAVVRRLNKEQGVTVVAITHFMREAVDADRLVVMSEGRVVMEGAPRAIFRRTEELRNLQLDTPHITQLAMALHERAPAFPADLLTPQEVLHEVQQRVHRLGSEPASEPAPNLQSPISNLPAPPSSISISITTCPTSTCAAHRWSFRRCSTSISKCGRAKFSASSVTPGRANRRWCSTSTG